MTRHVASLLPGHVPLHLGPHPLITAHAFDHFMHVPSFQAGPRARALTRMARTPRSRPRSGGPLAPVQDSEGPSAAGPVLLLRTAPRHGAEEPVVPTPPGPTRHVQTSLDRHS